MDTVSADRRGVLAPGARRPYRGYLRARDRPRRLLRPGDAHVPSPSADRLDGVLGTVEAARVRCEPPRRLPLLAVGGDAAPLQYAREGALVAHARGDAAPRPQRGRRRAHLRARR